MAKQSAGILLYRKRKLEIEVLLVHPGGPFWARKDLGAWSVPKGEFAEGEDPFAAAKREFAEELGIGAPAGKATSLGSAKQSSGKTVFAWAIEADLDVAATKSNTFEVEWPPKSGQRKQFREVDKTEWFTVSTAMAKLVKGQVPLIETLASKLNLTITSPHDTRPSELSLNKKDPTKDSAPKIEDPQKEQTSLF